MTEDVLGQDLALADPGIVQLVLDLEQTGALTPTSLTITDPDLSYEHFEALLRLFGNVGRSHLWWIGDLINTGEALFGEEAAQAIEATTKERYDLAERITGLEHQTLMNVRSICARVAAEQRRPELGFWIHGEVAALDASEQAEWLQKAIDEGWTRGGLRDAIRAAKTPPAVEPPAGDGGGGGGEGLSIGERVEKAARLVYNTWQATSDGSFLVPPESAAQLIAALGEEH